MNYNCSRKKGNCFDVGLNGRKVHFYGKYLIRKSHKLELCLVKIIGAFLKEMFSRFICRNDSFQSREQKDVNKLSKQRGHESLFPYHLLHQDEQNYFQQYALLCSALSFALFKIRFLAFGILASMVPFIGNE